MPALLFGGAVSTSACSTSSCLHRRAMLPRTYVKQQLRCASICCLSSPRDASTNNDNTTAKLAQLLSRRPIEQQHHCDDASSRAGFSGRSGISLQQEQMILSPAMVLALGAACAGPLMLAASAMAIDAIDIATASTSADAATTVATAAVAGAATGGKYVPTPMEIPEWQIWVGFVAGVIPFAIGSWEFGKRIIIQLRCEQCDGRGLVRSAGPGKDKYLRKCPQCGGFFPWVSWKMFLSSTAAPGNGGPLLPPKGQTSVFYTVPPPRAPKQPGQASDSQELGEDLSSSAEAPPYGSAAASKGGIDGAAEVAAVAGARSGPGRQA